MRIGRIFLKVLIQRKFRQHFWEESAKYLFHDFGRHPAGGPDERVPHFLPAVVPAGGQPRAYPEIGNLYGTVFAEQNVARFNVSENFRKSSVSNYEKNTTVEFQNKNTQPILMKFSK